MSPDCPEGDSDVSLARARSVNRSCERFEAEWRAGDKIRGLLQHFPPGRPGNRISPLEHAKRAQRADLG